MTVTDVGVEAALNAAEAGLESLRAARYDHLSNRERLEILQRLERVGRTVPGIGHELVHGLDQQNALAETPYGNFAELIAENLHIRLRSGRAMRTQSLLLGPRTAINGQMLSPMYDLVATAQREGLINTDHVRVILRFFERLPAAVSAEDRHTAEETLVELAKTLRPEQVEAAAHRLMAYLNPDGDLDDDRDRIAKTGFWLGPQNTDGLTRGTFCIDAPTRALLEAFFAKFAKPGMCNPEDELPVVTPVQDPPDTPPVDSTPSADNAPPPPRKRRQRRVCPLCGGDTDESGKTIRHPNEGHSGGSDSDKGRNCDDSAGEVHGECDGASDEVQPLDPIPPLNPGPDPEPELDLSLPPATCTDAVSGSGTQDASTHDAAALALAAGHDLRPYALRNLHALHYGLNLLLSDPRLGQHRGLPVTAVITMTVKDLTAATGKAITGGGTVLAIRDAIRMAANAYPYLLIFDDDGRPLYLGRGKRLATTDQRLVLYAGDRGCTFPGCPRPGYHCQVHHINEWSAKHGETNIDALTLCCDIHHALIGPGSNQWATTKAPSCGPYALRTVWHAPESIDPLRRGKVNHFHHPEEYLTEEPEFPGPDGQPPPPSSPQPPQRE